MPALYRPRCCSREQSWLAPRILNPVDALPVTATPILSLHGPHHFGGQVVAGLRAAKPFQPSDSYPHDSHTQSPWARSPAGRRLHFATVRLRDFIVHAACRFPSGSASRCPTDLGTKHSCGPASRPGSPNTRRPRPGAGVPVRGTVGWSTCEDARLTPAPHRATSRSTVLSVPGAASYGRQAVSGPAPAAWTGARRTITEPRSMDRSLTAHPGMAAGQGTPRTPPSASDP